MGARMQMYFRLLQQENAFPVTTDVDEDWQALADAVPDIHDVRTGAGPNLDLQLEGVAHLTTVTLYGNVGKQSGFVAEGHKIVVKFAPATIVRPVQTHHQHGNMLAFRRGRFSNGIISTLRF